MKNLLTILLGVFTATLLSAQISTPDTLSSPPPTTPPPATQPAAAAPAAEAPKKTHEKPAQRITWGLRGGISSMFFGSGTRGYSVSPQIGFNAGVYLRYYATKRLYIQPELNYYFSSYNVRQTTTLTTKEDKVKAHALQIPVLVGYYLVSKPKFGLLLQTGPAIGINLGVSDNTVGVTRSDFNTTYVNWIVDGQLRISRLTVLGGFVAGVSNYAFGSRGHFWYIGMGISI